MQNKNDPSLIIFIFVQNLIKKRIGYLALLVFLHGGNGILDFSIVLIRRILKRHRKSSKQQNFKWF